MKIKINQTKRINSNFMYLGEYLMLKDYQRLYYKGFTKKAKKKHIQAILFPKKVKRPGVNAIKKIINFSSFNLPLFNLFK